MINAELSYNPYLMETEIRFNGQPPRINSLVEKYQHMNLQAWINKIPKIFYDELNGYYFELDFSGTELDFDVLCNTFRKAGITEEIVPIVHKGKLEGRLIKQKELEELLEWLKNNPNKRFDYDAFRADNTDLFDGGYSYVFLHGHGLDGKVLDDMNVSVEHVDKVGELNDTDLDCTPILIHISEKTLPMLASELNYFKNRKDVTEEQLFFHIGEMLDERTVDRIIRDLGVINPKIVKTPEDTPVRKYIEVYPVTEYVRSTLTVLKIESSIIEKDLEKDNEESVIKNREIHEKIDGITDMLTRLRNAQDFYKEFSDSAPYSSMHELEEELLGKIKDWRSRKTKINKTEEARTAAADFENDAGKLAATYANKIKEDVIEKIEGIRKDFEVEYKNICYDNFEPKSQPEEIPDMKVIESFADQLMEMKEERYVEAKEDLIGMFFKSRQPQKEEREMVLEITFYYKVWRDYVAELIKDAVDYYIDKLIIIYKNFLNAVRKEYFDHISTSIEVETNRKNEVSSQLSDDEKLLQIDNEWFEKFVEQRMAIERG